MDVIVELHNGRFSDGDDLSQYTDATHLRLANNQLTSLKVDFSQFRRLQVLDLSANNLETLDVALPPSLKELNLRNNRLVALPSSLFSCPELEMLVVSGNKLQDLTGPFENLSNLRFFYAGGNRISLISDSISTLHKLELLHLGGNNLQELPLSICELSSLQVLHINENSLSSLPTAIAGLHSLRILHLHRNNLSVLPAEVLALRNLQLLSVRENPFVTSFAEQYVTRVPSLKELAARLIKKDHVHYHDENLPPSLLHYLDSAKNCHACSGAYFQAPSQRIEFADLCGAYQAPLLQYICSSHCQGLVSHSSTDPLTRLARLRKVLLDRYAPSLSAPVEALREELTHAHWDE